MCDGCVCDLDLDKLEICDREGGVGGGVSGKTVLADIPPTFDIINTDEDDPELRNIVVVVVVVGVVVVVLTAGKAA